MKRLIAGAAAILALAAPVAASAANPAGISYDTLYGVAADNAQCGTQAGSGAFAYFGNFGYVHDLGINNPGSNGKPGADGYQTGLNNSAVCGNRQ